MQFKRLGTANLRVWLKRGIYLINMDIASQQSMKTEEGVAMWLRIKKIPRLTLAITIFGVFVVIIAGALLHESYSKKSRNNELQERQTKQAERKEFKSNTVNIQFMVPVGWGVDSSKTVPLSFNIKESTLVLKKNDSMCTIVVASVDSGFYKLKKQISFADRITNGYGQFDGNWYLVSGSSSDPYSFSNNVRQYLSGEFRVTSDNKSQQVFILFMSNGASVPDECNSDLNSLLMSLNEYYETMQLTSSSTGTLTLQQGRLVYVDSVTGEKRKTVDLPSGVYMGQTFVLYNTLYFVSNRYTFNKAENRPDYSSALYSIDLFSGKVTEIPGSAGTDSYISSLYIQDATAFYLAGTSSLDLCLNKSAPCAAKLYSLPLTGGSSTFVAHSSLGGSILGYLKDENTFYVNQRWGDGGCSNVFLNKIVNGIEEEVGRLGQCGDEVETPSEKAIQEKMNTNLKKIKSSPTASKAISVTNGILAPSDNADTNYKFFYFVK